MRRPFSKLDDGTPQRAAVLHSVPDWLAEMWWSELGPERARALLTTVNTPAESAIRVESARSTPEQVKAALTDPTTQRGSLGPRMGGPTAAFRTCLIAGDRRCL